jgi:hypothetical protein
MSGTYAIAAAMIAAILASPAALRADLSKAKAESNLEKRSGLALENGAQALKSIREVYRKGDLEQVKSLVAEVQESVELAHTSLQQTGKNPRRSPKWFKRAEIATRNMAKSIESLQHEMSFTDRPLLDDLHSQVQQVHDDLLKGLMEGKKRR